MSVTRNVRLGNATPYIVQALAIISVVWVVSFGPNRSAYADAPSTQPGTQQEAVIRIIDAQAYTPKMSGGITNDPATQPAPTSMDRTAALADGTSVLVIKITGLTAGTSLNLTVGHTGATPDPSVDGSLWAYSAGAGWGFPAVPAPDAPTAAGIGSTSLTTIGDGSGNYFFYYRPPNNYLFGRRSKTKNVQISEASGIISTITITLHRPPIFIAHGIASSPAEMLNWQTNLAGTGGADVFLFNYEYENTDGVNVVAGRLHSKINDEINFLRSAKIAATRVDYCGHSFGGYTGKWYAQSWPDTTFVRGPDWYNLVWEHSQNSDQSSNFGNGDLRRVLTVGGPYQGSAIADALVALGAGDLRALISTTAGCHGSGEGIYDAGVYSITTVHYVTTTNPGVSWYTVVGQASPYKGWTDETGGSWILAALINAAGLGAPSVGYYPYNSDEVVLGTSQADGFGTNIHLIQNVVHSKEPDDPGVWSQSLFAFDLKESGIPLPANRGYALCNSSW